MQAQLPNKFSNELEDHGELFDWFGKELNISRNIIDSWLKVTKADVTIQGGGSLVEDHYNGSVIKPLQTIYPHFSWNFQNGVPKSFWDAFHNQRSYLDWIGKELRITKKEQWYKLNRAEFLQKGGGDLLRLYGDSIPKMLQSIYPEHQFLTWMFAAVPLKYWNNLQNQREYFEWLSKEMLFQQHSDWYHFKTSDLDNRGGRTVVTRYYSNSIGKALTTVFPEFNWQLWR